MAEYIERERLKHDLRNWIVDCEVNGEHKTADCLRQCIDLIDDTPAADVVEVVRCGECKYSRPMDDIEKMEYYESVIICESFEMNDCATAVYPDDFCSYGEREDGT